MYLKQFIQGRKFFHRHNPNLFFHTRKNQFKVLNSSFLFIITKKLIDSFENSSSMLHFQGSLFYFEKRRAGVSETVTFCPTGLWRSL